MRYLSIDIEAAGLSLESSILEIGLVLDDFSRKQAIEDLPRLRILFRHDAVIGQPYALGMHVDSGLLKELQEYKYANTSWVQDTDNGVLFNKETNTYWIQGEPEKRNIADYSNSLHSQELYVKAWNVIANWLQTHKVQHPIKLAGKNVATFDIPHLQAKGFTDVIPIDFRVLDLGSLYMGTDTTYGVGWIPNLKTCLHYAGIDKNVSHNALEDALDVVACIRRKLF